MPVPVLRGRFWADFLGHARTLPKTAPYFCVRTFNARGALYNFWKTPPLNIPNYSSGRIGYQQSTKCISIIYIMAKTSYSHTWNWDVCMWCKGRPLSIQLANCYTTGNQSLRLRRDFLVLRIQDVVCNARPFVLLVRHRHLLIFKETLLLSANSINQQPGDGEWFDSNPKPQTQRLRSMIFYCLRPCPLGNLRLLVAQHFFIFMQELQCFEFNAVQEHITHGT